MEANGVRKFRKKPVVIEAIQLTPEVAAAALIDGKQPGPFGLIVCGGYHPERRVVEHAHVHVPTANGRVWAHLGDWICKQTVNGKEDLWPCTQEIFEATYEPA